MKKPLRRFFMIAFMVPVNITTFSIGISFLIDQLLKIKENNINLWIIYIVLLSFQGISLLLLLISYLATFMNMSDKEIREEQCRNNYDADYLRSPQKYFFLIAMIGIVIATFAELIIISYLFSMYWIGAKKEIKEWDFMYNNYSHLIHTNGSYIIGCKNEMINCEELLYNFSNDTCSNFNKCPFCDREFYYSGKCGYLFNYIYKCTINNINNRYYCSQVLNCDEIEQFNFTNNCSDLDECSKYNSSFYYLGYCNYQKNLIYNCTMDDRYFDVDIFNYFYKCDEVDKCSEIDQFLDKYVCPYWENCSFSKNFYYSGYCDDNNYTDYIYTCFLKEFINYIDSRMVDNYVFFTVIIVVGCLQFIIVVTLIIVKICIKGSLFKKLLEISFTRYMLYFVPFFIYPLCIVIEFLLVYSFYHEIKNYLMEANFILAFDIVQIVSLFLFMLGITFVNINKSDIEIVENASEVTRPLFPT